MEPGETVIGMVTSVSKPPGGTLTASAATVITPAVSSLTVVGNTRSTSNKSANKKRRSELNK